LTTKPHYVNNGVKKNIKQYSQRNIIMMVTIKDLFEQIKSEFHVNKGRLITSIRGTARLADVSDMALRKHFASANLNPTKLAQMLIEYEINPANLAETGLCSKTVSIVLHYYGYDAGRYRKEQAKQLCLAFTAIGFEQWAKTQLGIDGDNSLKSADLETVENSLKIMKWFFYMRLSHRMLGLDIKNLQQLEDAYIQLYPEKVKNFLFDEVPYLKDGLNRLQEQALQDFILECDRRLTLIDNPLMVAKIRAEIAVTEKVFFSLLGQRFHEEVCLQELKKILMPSSRVR
jgi:hypothetical protein